ncbi:repetitive organellar protein-like [Diorhabda carinulata]|uniref:repetitive organellar protein-like n=1 Tax=Diorhabda carinulata TaxID=1163345 RepID=UPI0025A0F888|nr:repetitive organellar protein-like [Diorhabda carinulata]
MKKKPQQCTRQGKSNTNIRSFLSNLKENDLHFEDSQITQCVFLGVLRLKPVPSVFSSNLVPSVVVDNKSKRFKNNNLAKEINKNVSRKKDINKVISGRIGKKNTEKIKASIKKFPTKNSVIKLKFNMNRDKQETSSVNVTEAVRILPESLTKITPESVLTNKTITLNPITTVTAFNPVQNLFDKLKQQLDDKYSPSITEVSKESLFFNELLDVDKSSKKQKKSNKKNKSDKSSLHSLPSSSSSFSDNGYYSSNSLHTKSCEDVLLSNNNDIDDEDDCELLLNTIPGFVTHKNNDNNDVILIPDDTSNRSSPNQDVIIIDDVKNVRMSPRLNKNEQNSSNMKQKVIDANNIINLVETETNKKPQKISTDKPIKRRRTLIPAAIPSIFFNTPRLLRSELGQKKGAQPETRSVKLQKPENKQFVKQKREKIETKLKDDTENLIYEVVKSTEILKHSTETETKSQDQELIVEQSPPKVEPLIIKLKKSTEKVSNNTDQNGNEDIKNKEKNHKADAGKITKNLLFPRLLRSDINQQKDTKIKKSPKVLEKLEVETLNSTYETDITLSPQGKISVKSTKDLFENTSDLMANSCLGEKKTSSSGKKSPVGIRRSLRSDFCQEESNSKIINIEDTQETNTVIEIVDNSKHSSDENVETINHPNVQRQFRSAQSHKENEIINVDKTDIDKETNTDIFKDQRSETESVQTQSIDIEIIDVDLYDEKSKNNESHQKKSDDVNVIDEEVLSDENNQENLNNPDIIDVDNIETIEEASSKSSKLKSIAVVQPMSRPTRTPQKKVNDIEPTEIVNPSKVTPEKTRKNKNIDQLVQKQTPQKKSGDLDINTNYPKDDRSRKDSRAVTVTERRQLRSDDTQIDSTANTESIKQRTLRSNIVEETGSVEHVQTPKSISLKSGDGSTSISEVEPKLLESSDDPGNLKMSKRLVQDKEIIDGAKELVGSENVPIVKVECETGKNKNVKKTLCSRNKVVMNKSAKETKKIIGLQTEKKRTDSTNEVNVKKIVLKSNKKNKKITNKDNKIKKIFKSDVSHKRTADYQIINQADLIVNTTRSHSKMNISESVELKKEQSSDIFTNESDKDELSKRSTSQRKLLKDTKKSTTVKVRKVGRPKKNPFAKQSSRIEDSKSTEVLKKTADVVIMEQAETLIVHTKRSASKTKESNVEKPEIDKVKTKNIDVSVEQAENLESSDMIKGEQKKFTKKKELLKTTKGSKGKQKVAVKVIKPSNKKALLKRKSPQKKQENLNMITVVDERKSRKQCKVSPKSLRSSINPIAIKRELIPPVVEKVVAIIHTEPKPKDSYKTPEKNQTQKNPIRNKPRISKSQNFDDINVVKEIAPAKYDKLRKNEKKKVISDKSRVISKKKNILVAKKVRDNKKNGAKRQNKTKTILDKSELKNIPDESKQKLIKQVKNKLKNSKNGNLFEKNKKKSSKKSNIDWQNNDIIKKIIQEIKNTIFKRDSSKSVSSSKKIKHKKTAKPTEKPEVKKKKIIRAAKKKIIRTKEALKRKLRSARSTETTNSNQNDPPTKQEPQKPPETEENATDKNDSVIIINEVTLPKDINIVDKIINPTNKFSTTTNVGIIDSKKNDITVFDFDESEPESSSLRPPKPNDNPDGNVNKSNKQIEPQKKLYSRIPTKDHVEVSAPQKSLSRLTDTAEYDKRIFFENPTGTKVPQKRLYSEILVYSEDEEGETLKRTEIPQQKNASIESDTNLEVPSKKRKLLIPYLDDDGKPRKLWSIIDSPSLPRSISPPITPSVNPRRNVTPPRTIEQTAPSTSREKSPEPSASSDKKSPLKQPTIIEMFSKVWMKKENSSKTVSEGREEDNQVFSRPLPRVTNLPIAPSPARERLEDDDSDTESRVEWVPEEYAEYKFKYSSTKMMQYKPIFKCKICMMMAPSYYKLLKHRKEHEKKDKPYTCPQCGIDFANVDDFSAHLRIHKGKHPYMCPKCDAGFWTKSAYEAHIPVHILKKVKQPVKKFRCDICAKEFSKLCDVERHTRVHTGEKPCICNICNKRFQQAHNLSKHLITHLHIKPFVCEICNKQFGRNDVLRRHLLTHSVDKPVKCSVCFKGFIRHSQLLQHMRQKHLDVPVDDLREQFGDEEDLSDNRNEPDKQRTSSSVVEKKGGIKTEA